MSSKMNSFDGSRFVILLFETSASCDVKMDNYQAYNNLHICDVLILLLSIMFHLGIGWGLQLRILRAIRTLTVINVVFYVMYI